MEIFRLFGSIFIKNSADKELDKTNKKAKDTQNTMSSSFSKIGKTASSLGSTMIKGLTLPIVGVGAAAVKLGMDFEASMSNVSALSGATGKELKTLENKAREMGSKTSKSAKDAADAMGYMALAGWKSGDMLKGIEPVLRLSEAGNLDLARASDLVTDSMSAMGVGVNELGDYLDIVAQSSRSSNTEIDEMAEAYIIAGGNLKGLNVSMKESAVVLGMLANRGIKGSQAGTALNAVITNLTAPTGQAKKALKALNISAFDSQGKFKGLTNVLKEVDNKTKNLTEGQRQQYLSMIGGKEHIKDLKALLTGLNTEHGTLTKQVNNSKGALMEMANVMKDNNKGSITELKSALEELALKLYDNLRPAISDLIKLFQKWTKKLNEMTPQQQKLLIGVAKFIAVLPIVTKAVGGLINGIMGLGKIITFFMANPWALIIVAIIGLVSLVISNWETIKKKTKELWDGIVKYLSDVFNDIKDNISKVWTNITTSISEAWENVVKVTSEKWNNIKDTVGKFVKGVSDGIKEGFKEIGDFFKGVWDFIINIFKGAFLIIKFVVQSGMTLIKTLIELPLRRIKWLFETIWALIGDTVKKAIDKIKNTITERWTVIKYVTEKTWNMIVDYMSKAWEKIKGIVMGPINYVVGKVTDGWNKIKEVTQIVWDKITSIKQAAWNKIVGIVGPPLEKIKKSVGEAWENIKSATSEKWNAVKESVGGRISAIEKVTNEKAQEIYKNMSEKWNNVKTSTSNAWNNIKDSITGKFNVAKDGVSKNANTIGSSLSSKWNSISNTTSQKWNSIKESILAPMREAKNRVSGIIEEIKSFFRGLKLKFPKIQMPPLPQFRLEGKFSLKEMTVPKLRVKWHNDGGIFTKPTLLGGHGVGDAVGGRGSAYEAVLPISKLSGMMADTMKDLGYSKVNDGTSKEGDIIINMNGVNIDSDIRVEQLAQELEFYRRQNSLAKGGK